MLGTVENMAKSESYFGDIALCLSGGGYLAAAFDLGVLTMLEELGVLDEVTILSTASGGTLTGMSYAVSRVENVPFKEFSENLRGFLLDVNIVQLALDNLDKKSETGDKHGLSLICQAAQVYADERLFGGRTFRQLLDGVKNGSHFKELVFNATEFSKGIGFRFRASDKHSVKSVIGNKYFQIPPEIAGEIRLADIMAASACFPVAFEPIGFPDDFRWKRPLEDVKNDLKQNFGGECLPLMDGGIFDNQGVHSASQIVDVSRENLINLFLIADVNEHESDALLKQTQNSRRKGFMTLKRIWRVTNLVAVFALISICVLVWGITRLYTTEHLTPTLLGLTTFVYSIPVVLCLAVLTGWIWVERLMIRYKTIEIRDGKFELWKYAGRLTIPDLFALLERRANSFVSMVGGVFMKRIRAQSLSAMFANPNQNSRIATCFLYDINPTNERNVLFNKDPDLRPTAEMIKLSQESEQSQVNLWFSKPENLDDLILCGRITACFALLKYLQTNCEIELKDLSSAKHKFYYNVAKPKWMAFKKTGK